MNVIEGLRAAKALIKSPDKWCKWHYFMDGRFCALGAARIIESKTDLDTLQDWLERAVRKKGYSNVPNFNDYPGIQHKDVLELFDLAICMVECKDEQAKGSQADTL